MERVAEAGRTVIFGVGAEASTAPELVGLGATRVMLVAQDRHAAGATRLAAELGGRFAGTFLTSGPQVPAEVASAAVRAAREAGADWVLAHGGGTPIGVAKAIALELPVKLAAVPTTYAGSEGTDIWGLTRDGRKVTGRDGRVRPSLVVYDPALTVGLARDLSLQSLVNALAHGVEALYAADASPLAREGATACLAPIVEGIRGIAADPSDLGARVLALRGAWRAADALGGASMGLHHKLAHVLGGSFGTPHAATHAVLLPYTFGFNAPFAEGAARALGHAWGTYDPAAWLYDLLRAVGLPTSLRAIGLGEGQLPAIADEALRAAYANPREVTRASLEQLLMDALHDRRPSAGTARIPLPASASGPHARLAVSARGAPEGRARAVVIALHGRGASADRFLADLERRIGPRGDVRYVAPQAADNTWYPKGFLEPVEANQPGLDSALSVVEALYAEAEARHGADRVVLVGFSQGACLLLTWLSVTRLRPRRALAFTGAPTPLPEAPFAAADGLRLHLGSSAADPWIARDVFEAAILRFREAGALVDATLVPGSTHGVHAPDDAALRDAVAAAAAGDDLRYLAGFGGFHASEARPGALPADRNSPRRPPYGAYAEQINGTGFAVRRGENQRTWMYRLRPQILPSGWEPLPAGRFTGDFSQAVHAPEVLGYRPFPLPDAPTDLLDGLITFAGAGDPTVGRGAAVHLYAANRDMVRRAFVDVDGDLLFVPELGRLHLRTELGRLTVLPGEIACVPRGIRFAASFPDGQGRGVVAEVFDGHLRLPERGVVGANGLADERHFLVPTADGADEPGAWSMIAKQGGRLWRAPADHGPFDVIAWHGNYVPWKYDLARFTSLGSASVDHPDPSILTVVSCPVDPSGRSALDLAVFKGRWDVSEGTFRPPFFHRNAATEFNAVLRSPEGSRWRPGALVFTPLLAPHAISASAHRRVVEMSDAEADRPERLPDASLWIQLESTYSWGVMPEVLSHEARDRDHLRTFAGYRPPEVP